VATQEPVDEGELDAASFERIAQDAWWRDDAVVCLSARERAYRSYRTSGDDRGAARAATALGYDAALFGEGLAVAQGWLSRAHELLHEQDRLTPEHGWLQAREAELALNVMHQPERAFDAGTRAAEIGDELGIADLQFAGRALVGLAVVRRGNVEDGLARLNESVAAALAGDVADPMWMGKICCWLVAACLETQDLARAVEWCARVERVCRENDLLPLFDVCRIIYASVQIESGQWREAEDELIAAIDRMRASRRGTRLGAVMALGELRRREGRLEEAEGLFGQAEFDPRAILGRALIQLDRGHAGVAWDAMTSMLAALDNTDTLVRARILRAATRCAIAAGKRDQGVAASLELDAIARRVGTPALTAQAAEAAAFVAEPAAAAQAWLRAVTLFHEAGLPFDEAEARLELASALTDSPDEARAHLREAERTLVALGVVRPGRVAALAPSGRDLITPREREVLRLVATGMTTGDVASALVISEHTVHRHVANILAKLDAPTRAAAVSIAARSGLI
jgi:DNA-binding CsgD family transcriptional regulator